MTQAYALQLKDLSKTYANGVQALRNVNLTVSEGDFFALLGPNGAGKSTLIGIISSLVNKSSGKVILFGDSMDDSICTVKRYIGVVPQEFNFNQFEKVEQIIVNQAGYYGIPRSKAMRRAESLLTELNLWDKRDVQARTLSGGMKRRLMIARAMIHQPKLLLLDEPTAGVDIELRHKTWELVRTMNQQGITIILTTHYLEEAEMLCRNIAIINHGELVENSSMSDLLAKLDVETFAFELGPYENPPTLSNYSHRLLGNATLEVDISRSQGFYPIVSQLEQQGIHVVSIRSKSNRLETLFVHSINRPTQTVEL